MVKVILASVAIALGATACSGTQPPPLPPVWSAGYAVPFDAMVSCLAAKPAGAFVVSAPDLPQDGVAVIAFTPANTAGRVDLYGSSIRQWQPGDLATARQCRWPGLAGWRGAHAGRIAAAIPEVSYGAFSTAAQAAGSFGR